MCRDEPTTGLEGSFAVKAARFDKALPVSIRGVDDHNIARQMPRAVWKDVRLGDDNNIPWSQFATAHGPPLGWIRWLR